MDAQVSSNAIDFDSIYGDAATDDTGLNIQRIVRAFDEIPDQARCASITQVMERKLNRQLLSTILNQPEPQHASDWARRIEMRKQRLSPYLRRTLVCVFIRLPGVHFTLEVDPESETVVHWEWDIG